MAGRSDTPLLSAAALGADRENEEMTPGKMAWQNGLF
jgi:hypothetical protein